MSESSITQFQEVVAHVFFALPEADSFLLAGGLALAAHGLTTRPTEDLDAFTSRPGDVSKAFDAFARAANERRWSVEAVQASETFVRLRVSGHDQLIIDLALDSPPDMPPTMSILGPTFAPEELAARKLLALFDRAMPRDFVDVFHLARRWNREDLMALTATIDSGFKICVFATALRQLDRYRDSDIPIDGDDVTELRSYFHAWVKDLGSVAAGRPEQASENS